MISGFLLSSICSVGFNFISDIKRVALSNLEENEKYFFLISSIDVYRMQ